MVRRLCCFSVILGMSLLSRAAFAQNYAGDQACSGCHKPIFDDYRLSGHPYKLNYIGGVEPAADTWPHTPPPPTAETLENGWEDVEYVIGNFFWKARFVQRDGYIHTGDAVQYNLATGEFSGYHSGELKPYNCQRCHCTGEDYTEGTHQGGLPGITGTWALDGVQCEACHGPAGDHANSGFPPTVFPTGGKDCDECHYRDEDFRMPWKGGFMRHHQQGEDLSHSPHDFHCTTCHDPHKSVVYGLGGTITECTDCHAAADHQVKFPGMAHLDCVDCHMPFMGKSAVATGPYSADIRGHLFRIMTDPIAAADNVTDGFWNQDENGNAAITLDYACLACHNDEGDSFTLSLEGAAAAAAGIHTPDGPGPLAVDVKANGLDDFEILTQADNVSVDVTVAAGASDGVPADWFIVASTNWGWYYWDPTLGWLPGLYPSLVDFPIFEVDPPYNVYDGTLFAGYYTFWFGVFANDGTMALDTMPVYVLP